MAIASLETYSREILECSPAASYADTVIVVDRDMNVVLEQAQPQSSHAASWVLKGKLAPKLEHVVRAAASNWINGASLYETVTAAMSESSVVRMVPLQGVCGPVLALTVESHREDQLLVQALKRFSLTQRELQVLRFILDGAQADEIASELHIAENTVQVYFKRLLAKTRARNRASMVATVLNWGVRREREAK